MDRLALRTLLVQLVLLLCAQDFHTCAAAAQVSWKPNALTGTCLRWNAASSTALQQRHAVRLRELHSRLCEREGSRPCTV